MPPLTVAEDELALGSSLSASDQRSAQQSARSAMAARGLYDSNQAIGAEVLNSYNLGRQRLGERRQFAEGVTGLLRSGAAADSALQSDYINRLGSSSSVLAANRFDPYAGILGASSGNSLSLNTLFGTANNNALYNAGATRTQFDPFNSYMANLGAQNASTTFQGGMARAGSYSDAANSLASGLSSYGGYLAMKG